MIAYIIYIKYGEYLKLSYTKYGFLICYWNFIMIACFLVLSRSRHFSFLSYLPIGRAVQLTLVISFFYASKDVSECKF